MHDMLICPPYAALQHASSEVYVGRPLGTGTVLMHFPSDQVRV